MWGSGSIFQIIALVHVSKIFCLKLLFTCEGKKSALRIVHDMEVGLHDDDCAKYGRGGPDCWRCCVMNMSKQRENWVSGVTAYSNAAGEFFTPTDLSLQSQSHLRCLYTARDARQQGVQTLMRQMTVSWIQDRLQAFSFCWGKKMYPYFPSSKYRQQTPITRMSRSRWWFRWARGWDMF
jgi:hypothetical protein